MFWAGPNEKHIRGEDSPSRLADHLGTHLKYDLRGSSKSLKDHPPGVHRPHVSNTRASLRSLTEHKITEFLRILTLAFKTTCSVLGFRQLSTGPFSLTLPTLTWVGPPGLDPHASRGSDHHTCCSLAETTRSLLLRLMPVSPLGLEAP